MRRRLDAELVRRGFAVSLRQAREAIMAGRVTVASRPATKAATLVAGEEPVQLLERSPRFASRGGDKLDAALSRFRIDPSGRDCLDAGASTGGFTDCLLQRGAARVIALDVGYGQFAWTLRNDQRVSVLERTNVRTLRPDDLPFEPDLVVADLSFISLKVVVAALSEVASESAEFVLLVKPQFEAEKGHVGTGGVVGDPVVWRGAIDGVIEAGRRQGLLPLAVMSSRVTGSAGNVEFLLHLARQGDPAAMDVDAAIAEGIAVRTGQ